MAHPIAGASRRTVIRVFLLTFVIYAYFMPRWADWNIDSRLALVHSIVDRHTLRIDAFHWITWDKAEVCDRHGRCHFYSDKAPGTAFMGVAVYGAYAALRAAPVSSALLSALRANGAWNVAIRLGTSSTQASPAPRGTNLGGCQRGNGANNVQYIPWGNRLVPPVRDWALSKYVVSVGVVSLLSALFAAFLLWFLTLFMRSRRLALLVTGLYALCTVALPYSTNFYSHQIVAATLFISFALLWLIRTDRVAGKYAPLAGLLLGFSFFTEYTIIPIAAMIGLYGLVVIRGMRHGAQFVVAALVPVLALFAYNKACFGAVLDTGYSHDFCWSAAQAAGFAGFTYPHLGPLFDLTVGSFRGLFYMSPFLLLFVPGCALMVRRGMRPESLLCGAVCVSFVLLISSYWGWNGGKVDGPRYLVPMVPFAVFPAAFVIDQARSRGWLWCVIAPMAAWSVFATWVEFLGGELFPISWLRDPIFQYSLPQLSANHVAPNAGLFFGLSGWQSLLPLAGCLVALAGIFILAEMRGPLAGRSMTRLREAPPTH